MTEKILWVEANLNNSTVAKLVDELTRKNQSVESGGCGCGCGDGSIGRAAKAQSHVKHA
jgi:hypothetical protein